MALLGLMNTLPPLIRILGMAEGFPAESRNQQAVLSRYFYFQVYNAYATCCCLQQAVLYAPPAVEVASWPRISVLLIYIFVNKMMEQHYSANQDVTHWLGNQSEVINF